MAKSRFEYVKHFERDDSILPECFLIVRVDGHKFKAFVKDHDFDKPNDINGLNLMNACAQAILNEWSDVVLAYGHSDEFSFLIPAWSNLFSRRSSKIGTLFASLFTSNYVFHWPKFFDKELIYPPAFDSRVVAYPSSSHIRDYFSHRQADCHINNLYNTTFWALVKNGLTKQEAEKKLSGTLSAEKNEILFSSFGINYNNVYSTAFHLFQSLAL